MDLEEHTKRYRALDEWFSTPLGQRVARAFSDEVFAFCSKLRGESLLQLGQCGSNAWLDHLQYSHKFIASPCLNQVNVSITCHLSQLPIDRNSIDCIIAPLTIEGFSWDKTPLDEWDRVLKPMGYMVFWGINPFSFWGLSLRLGCQMPFGHSASKATSFFTLKRALLNRGYLQCRLNTFYYIPPFEHQRTIHAFEFMNAMGKMIWLFPAGFYCLVVQKQRVITPTPIVTSAEWVLDGVSY